MRQHQPRPGPLLSLTMLHRLLALVIEHIFWATRVVGFCDQTQLLGKLVCSWWCRGQQPSQRCLTPNETSKIFLHVGPGRRGTGALSEAIRNQRRYLPSLQLYPASIDIMCTEPCRTRPFHRCRVIELNGHCSRGQAFFLVSF